MPGMRLEPPRRLSIICSSNMDNRPVLYYDSGLGGLCYGLSFHSSNPKERLICLGDRANFPYGTKSKEELVKFTIALTKKIIALYDPKIMAVACNAASVSALAELREEFPQLPIVGTVPAVKPAVLASKKRRIGILGTQRTNSDPYIESLIAQYGPDCTAFRTDAPELVQFIEHRWTDADKTEKLRMAANYIDQFREKGADAAVLACTHFVFLKDEFIAASGEDIKIYDSVDGIKKRVEFFLHSDNDHLCSDSKTEQPVTMAVTGDGPPDPCWEKLALYFGIKLERI